MLRAADATLLKQKSRGLPEKGLKANSGPPLRAGHSEGELAVLSAAVSGRGEP